MENTEVKPGNLADFVRCQDCGELVRELRRCPACDQMICEECWIFAHSNEHIRTNGNIEQR